MQKYRSDCVHDVLITYFCLLLEWVEFQLDHLNMALPNMVFLERLENLAGNSTKADW